MKTINYLFFCAALLCIGLGLNAQTQIGNDIIGEAAEDWSGSSVSMPDNTTVAIGAPNNDGNGTNAGHVRIYTWNGSTWVQKGNDIDGEAAGDQSGYSIGMPDANTVAIGAFYNDGNGTDAGHVRIYSWNGSAWIQKGSDIDGEAANDWSGTSVSMPDAGTVAIGSPGNDGNGTNAGQVRIYEWNGGAWAQKGNDIDGNINDFFGSTVSMPDANTVAIAAPQPYANNGSRGYVQVYSWNGSAWVLKGNDFVAGEYDALYYAGMPNADTLAITLSDVVQNTVITHIYAWNGSTWMQMGNDINGVLGFIMSDPNILVSAYNRSGINGTYSGTVWIYKWNGSDWVQAGNAINGHTTYDFFGTSVSMPDANTIAIGGPGNGAGYVGVYDLSDVLGISSGEWESKVSLFPNPTHSGITVDLGRVHEKINLFIRNVTGQEVFSRTYPSTARIETEIPGGPGCYFVEISTANNQKKVFKVMKN